MNVLIVDDELVSRMKLQKILETFGEISSHESGPAALEAFESALIKGRPFELVLLDISMPGMDGTEVLLEMKGLENACGDRPAKILMVTAQCDRNSVVTCVQAGCDGYIVKPFDRRTVFAKLAQAGVPLPAEALSAGIDWGAAMRDLIADFADGNELLPVQPRTVRDVRQLLATPPIDDRALAQVIERDPVLSARIIAEANSAPYCGTSPVRSVVTAVPRLGPQGVADVISVLTGRSFYEVLPPPQRQWMDLLWQHARACAHAGRLLAERTRYRDAERIFLMGLVHDIGKVILFNGLASLLAACPEVDIRQVLALIREHDNEFSARVLERWAFPEEFAAAARHHDDAELHPLTPRPTLLIHLASALAREHGFSLLPPTGCDPAALPSAVLLEVDAAALESIGQVVEAQMRAESDDRAAA